MDEKIALHTAARRYCMEQAPALNPLHEEQWYRDRRWLRNRELLIAWSNARGTGNQIELLGAILFQIERVLPDDFSSLNALRTFLLETDEAAYNVFFTSDSLDDEREKNKEKVLFQTYIKSLTMNDLLAITPLPYRRVLTEHEIVDIWRHIEQCWGITAKMHWYPLNNVSPPPHVIALQEDWFAFALPPDVLRNILMQHGIRRVWELREDGSLPQYEMDVAFLVSWDGGAEHVWTSEGMDWMIYTSHESSITLGGQWLLDSVKQIWPQWKDHIYTDYSYQHPLRERY